jgi:hypothetical protein
LYDVLLFVEIIIKKVNVLVKKVMGCQMKKLIVYVST